MSAALEEYAVIGDLLFPDLRTAELVAAVEREDLRGEHFADSGCRAAFEAMRHSESGGRDAAANQRIVTAASGMEFAERAIAAADCILANAIGRIATVAERGRKRLIAEAANAALLARGSYSEGFLRAELHRIAEIGCKRGDCAMRLLPLGEFLAEPPESVDPVVEGCFEFGDKVELIAPSKCRKSFFCD